MSEAAENVLMQLKNMFCHLQHSERQFYDPTETFCKAFKDRGGNPIDLHMQQDAEEFLRLLCERLEEQLKGTEYVRQCHPWVLSSTLTFSRSAGETAQQLHWSRVADSSVPQQPLPFLGERGSHLRHLH